MKAQTYLKVLFFILAVLIASAVGYVVYFATHYPLPITSRISFDAKLKFVRDKIDVNKIDTIIVGSSIGLNDIQGTYLEKNSKKCQAVLNLSVYEATTLESEQLLELRQAFPHLKRMIYSVQYSDTPHTYTYDNFDAKVLSGYMAKTLDPLSYLKVVFDASKNIVFLYQRQEMWKQKHMQNNSFHYLGFDSSGSVPLHIYGKDIIQHRWKNPQPNIQHPKSFEAIDRIAKKAQEEGLYFYIAHQPYRAPLVKKYKRVKAAIHDFDTRVDRIFSKYSHAKLVRLQLLHLNDDYFADRSHLNDKGSIETAKAMATFIDKNEK